MLLVTYIRYTDSAWEDILPAIVYEYDFDATFEGFGSDISVSTYLPPNNDRQRILDERMERWRIRSTN